MTPASETRRRACASSALVLSLCGLTLSGSALAADPPYLAVIEKIGGAVGFFAEDGRPLAQVKVGSFPHEGALSRDGRFLYVSNNGVLWMTEDSQGTNSISVVDVRAMKKAADIDLGRFHRPHGMALVPGSGQILATTERPFGLIMVDWSTRQVIRDYDVKGKSPHMVFPMPDGEWVYVSDTDSDSVVAIQLKTGNAKVIPTGARPQGAALSPAGDRLYVACADGNRISIIDTRKQEVVGTIPTGKGPARIAITPDGTTLVYNLGFEPGVGFADVASGRQTAMVPLSGRPLSLTMTRDGRRAFAGVQDQDKVFFISVAQRKVERVLATPKGSGPDPAIPLESWP
ncbi:MAG TPA: beta-propeller fold lactonase family protein [Candidatus Acidoferrales bacterium]|jgi:YVTN family beta-propeller protein|nr:beta-propeller fold lactonase family protein [Candidatus Acidoferrales bacterium]